MNSVAYPGFPVGGGGHADPLGGATSEADAYKQKTHAKMKELGPMGMGVAQVEPPGSATDDVTIIRYNYVGSSY